jgi:hypothetical protein
MFPNAVAWVNFRHTGGLRTHAIIGGVFLLALGVFYTFSHYVAAVNSSPGELARTRASVDSTWMVIVSIAAAIFLLLMSSGAIRSAVLRDFQSGMIESHRISPMSNTSIIGGYLLGPPSMAAVLMLVALIFGSYLSVRTTPSIMLGAGMPAVTIALGAWYFTLATVAVLGLFLASLTLLAALATSGKARIMGIVIAIGIFGGWILLAVIPGLSLLLGALSGEAIVRSAARGGAGRPPMTVVVTAITQLLFSLVVLWAAARKLRAPQSSLFSPMQASVLLALWAATLVLGVVMATVNSSFLMKSEVGASVQVIASVVAFLVVGLLGLDASARECVQLDRVAALGVAGNTRRRTWLSLMPVMQGLGAAAVFYFLMDFMAAATPDFGADLGSAGLAMICAAAVSLIAFSLTGWGLIYVGAAAGGKRWILTLLALLVLLFLPLIVDESIESTWQATREHEPGKIVHWPGYGTVSGLSPIGTMSHGPIVSRETWLTLLFQVATAAGALWLASRSRTRMKPRQPIASSAA